LKPLLRWAAVALAGVLVGALGLRAVEALTVDAALERQKLELTQLAAELHQRQTELKASEARVEAQAESISQAVVHAEALADQVWATQGSTIERLKAVIDAVKQLRDDLKSLPVN